MRIFRHNSTFQVRPKRSSFNYKRDPFGLRRRRVMKKSTSSFSTFRIQKFKRGRVLLNRVGPRTREWRNTVVRLKKRYAAMGITSCELRYEGCFGNEALGFAHGRKRRKLLKGELEHLCILLCNFCHDKIEFLPAEEMLAIVESVIANREKVA